MKITNVILTIFITATIAQAQITEPIGVNENIASVVDIPFSETTERSNSGKLTEKGVKPVTSDLVFFCYPSLFSTELFVTTNSIEASEIQLVNEAGQTVFKIETEGMIENERLEMPETLPAGTYFLKMKDKEETAIRLMKRD